MLQTLRLTHSGPTDFVADDLEPKPFVFNLSCPEGLPVAAEVRVIIEGFRAFTDGGWKLEGAHVTEGEGRIVIGHGLPLHFRELVWPGISPGGGQLIGGDHRRIQLCTLIVTKALESGTKLVITFETVGARHARIYPTLELMARLQSEGEFTTIGERVSLNNHPGDPVHLEFRTKPVCDPDGALQGVLFATDEFGNPSPSYSGSPTFSQEVLIEEKKPGRHTVQGRCPEGINPHRIEVVDADYGLKVTAPPVITTPKGTGNHYFGAIHFHTEFSVDGDGRLEDAYAYARDWLNLDVIAGTDHAPLGYQWEDTLRINDRFNDPHRFVTIPAWESSTAFGHANIYLRSNDTDADPSHWNPARNPSEETWPSDAIVVPHHTNAGEEPFTREEYEQALSDGIYWTVYDWSIPNPRVRLAEIVQGRGDFEADAVDEAWEIHQGNRGASIQDAFRMGWRLGFVGGSDNHQAYPTQMSGRYFGLTCFLSPELTRRSVWEAMDQRRTYATSGVQIVCDYSINGLPMGSEGKIKSGDPVYFSASLHGTAPIEQVEIISNGEVIWHKNPGAWDITLTDEVLSDKATASAYYYLRLRQEDGNRAWLSPVWLDVKNH